MEEEKKSSLHVQRQSSLINNVIIAPRFQGQHSQIGLLRQPSEWEKFEDVDFKPCLASLIRDPSNTRLNEKTVKEWHKLEWKRASQFMDRGYKIFDGVPKIEDINQGSLGNCYFLSALAALAQYPNMIRRIFKTEEVNEFGQYAVNLCINGEFQMVEIDDFFPCWKGNHGNFSSAFSKPRNNNLLWVLILEKAWAKVNGSYDLTVGGQTSDAISCLTGAPSEYMSHKKVDQARLWSFISESIKMSFLVTSSSRDVSEQEINQYSKNSNIIGHSYSILSAIEVSGIKVLQVRNPWGLMMNYDEFEQNSRIENIFKMDEESVVKFGLEPQHPQSGIFYVLFDEFLNYFSDTQVSKVLQNFSFISIKSQPVVFSEQLKNSKHQIVSISIQQKSKAYFQVVLPLKRLTEKYNLEIPYEGQQSITMVIGKITQNQKEPIEFIDGNTEFYSTQLALECELSPGDYVALIDIEYNQDLIVHGEPFNTFVFSTYTETEQILSYFSIDNATDYLSQLMISFARKEAEKNGLKELNADYPLLLHCFDWKGCMSNRFGYFYFRNNYFHDLIERQKPIINLKLEFNQLQNIEIQDIHIVGTESFSIYEQMTQTVEISIPPTSDALVILKYDRQPRINYQFTISKINSDQAYIEAFKSLAMQLPGFEHALANVELKLNVLEQRTVLHSDIRMLSSFIDDGFIMLIYNPEYSQRGLDAVFTFHLTNLSIQGYLSNQVKIQNLMPGEHEFIRFEKILINQKVGIRWDQIFNLI